MMKYYVCILIILNLLGHATTTRADISSYDRRAAMSFGVEINLLWLAPPFKSIELKAWTRLSDSVDFVFGYGGQFWSIDSEKMNSGTMNSHALILGARAYLFKTDTLVEYDTWLAYDRLDDRNGKRYAGFSQSNEFFGGYQFFYGGSNTYSTAGLNLGFWSYKGYAAPIDDRFVPTILPKFFVGEGIK
jgi:hypothetical protein